MKRKVQIVKRPKAQSGLEVRVNPGMGFNANQLSWPVMAGEFSAADIKANRVLPPVERENANLEAEDGETVLTALTGGSIPEFYKIGGKRHSAGGTPLNLPADSFIYSRDNSMKIKDEAVQKMFGKTYKKGGYTPAEISKAYDINKFREILADPNSDDLQRKTAEMMITNFNLKLGGLALAQESIKGFPQGIPKVAMPYLEVSGMNPEEFTQTQGERDETGEEDQARYGGLPKAQYGNIPGLGSDAADFQSKYPQAFNRYMSALASNNPALMIQAADELENSKSQTGSMAPFAAFFPWTDSDKFEDLSAILKEEASKRTDPEWIKGMAQRKAQADWEKKQADYGVYAKGIWNKMNEELAAIPETDYQAQLSKANEISSFANKYLPENRVFPFTGGRPTPYGDDEFKAMDQMIAARKKSTPVSKTKPTSSAKAPALDFSKMTDAELEAIANSTPED